MIKMQYLKTIMAQTPLKINKIHFNMKDLKDSINDIIFFLFMSDAHHGINSSTQKYQSTQSSAVLTSCRQDSGSPPF